MIKTYFKDEAFELKTSLVSEICDKYNISTVVSHTSPDVFPPYTFHPIVEKYAKQDKTLIEELKSERSELTTLFNLIKVKCELKNWICGHFHQTHNYKFAEVQYKCLNINEFTELI